MKLLNFKLAFKNTALCGALTIVAICAALPVQAGVQPYSCNPQDGGYIHQYWSSNANSSANSGSGHGIAGAAAGAYGGSLNAGATAPDIVIIPGVTRSNGGSGNAQINSYSEMVWVLGALNLESLESTLLVQDLTVMTNVIQSGNSYGYLDMSGSSSAEGLLSNAINLTHNTSVSGIHTFGPLSAIGGPLESVRVIQQQNTNINSNASTDNTTGDGGHISIQGTVSLNGWVYGVTPAE